MDTIESEPRQRLADLVAAEVEEQRAIEALNSAYAAADEEPTYDKKLGVTNFGRRLAAKIQIAQQE
jgi:hypothetical protein